MNSIGVAIDKIYAETYPRTVSRFLILDSTITNLYNISTFPDPTVSGFEGDSLPEGVTEQMYIEARRKIAKGYHIMGPTREVLWRGTI